MLQDKRRSLCDGQPLTGRPKPKRPNFERSIPYIATPSQWCHFAVKCVFTGAPDGNVIWFKCLIDKAPVGPRTAFVQNAASIDVSVIEYRSAICQSTLAQRVSIENS